MSSLHAMASATFLAVSPPGNSLLCASTSRPSSTSLAVAGLTRNHDGVLRFSARKPSVLKKRSLLVCCEGNSSDESSGPAGNGKEDNKSKPPPKPKKKEPVGPFITSWGGNVKGGKYQLGQGTDRILELFANGDGFLIGAIGLIMLFLVLLQFRPPPPPV